MKLWNYIRGAMLLHPNQQICEKQVAMTFEEMVVFAELFAGKLVGESCCAIVCRSEMAAAMALLSSLIPRQSSIVFLRIRSLPFVVLPHC